jgi:serine/threonine protein kinase
MPGIVAPPVQAPFQPDANYTTNGDEIPAKQSPSKGRKFNLGFGHASKANNAKKGNTTANVPKLPLKQQNANPKPNAKAAARKGRARRASAPQMYQNAMALAQQDTIGIHSFELITLLGQGGVGVVWYARKKDTREVFAVKIIEKHQIMGTSSVARVLAERDLMTMLDHPFVIDLSFAFQDDTRIFFVLEYLSGGDFFKLLHSLPEKRMPEGAARFYTVQILLALHYLHKQNIIFRDLKPENVILNHDGNLRVTDFGLAMKGGGGAQHGGCGGSNTVCGTPEYMAPEVIKEDSHSIAVDYWALGVMLFEMLHGHTPWANQSTTDMFFSVLTKPPQFHTANTPGLSERDRVTCSPECKSLIEGLMAKDANTRLGANGADEVMKHPWFNGVNWSQHMRQEVLPPYPPGGASARGNKPSKLNKGKQTEESAEDDRVARHREEVQEMEEQGKKQWQDCMSQFKTEFKDYTSPAASPLSSPMVNANDPTLDGYQESNGDFDVDHALGEFTIVEEKAQTKPRSPLVKFDVGSKAESKTSARNFASAKGTCSCSKLVSAFAAPPIPPAEAKGSPANTQPKCSEVFRIVQGTGVVDVSSLTFYFADPFMEGMVGMECGSRSPLDLVPNKQDKQKVAEAVRLLGDVKGPAETSVTVQLINGNKEHGDSSEAVISLRVPNAKSSLKGGLGGSLKKEKPAYNRQLVFWHQRVA